MGLVSGTCFAETGNHVTCVDIDASKVERLTRGEVTIYEPGLEALFERNLKEGRLYFTTDLAKAVENAEIIFLALPTPPGEDGSADLSYILGVAKQLGQMISSYKVVVDKSTVPVGTAERVQAAIAANATVPFDVVSNPEFLREGAAIEDFMKPDRIVVGTSSARAEEVMRKLYAPFVRQGNPIIMMDERSAEMTKYAANAYLATRITFMNEVANLCEKVGANVDAIRKGIGTDKRIGPRFLFPGVGYGGSCFPKDVQALGKTAQEHQYDFKILNSVMDVNDYQRTSLVRKVKNYYKNNLKGLRLAIWGLAFKPNTDDIREAPALYTIDALLAEGATITAYDPEAMPNVQRIYGSSINFAQNAYQTLDAADALLILTEWSVFRTPDFDEMAKKLKNKIIFDGRNLYEVTEMRSMGWHYESIGRP